MTAYAFFFSQHTFNENRLAIEDGKVVPIEYIASGSKRPILDFVKGDELFIVGIQGGKVLLAGRMVVLSPPEDRTAVITKTGRNDYYKKPLICLGNQNFEELFRPNFEIPYEISKALELFDKHGNPYKNETVRTLRDGKPDANIFRACPRLSEISANQLRLLLGSKPIHERHDVPNPVEVDNDDYRMQRIKSRRGQPEFRRNLMQAYEGKCLITKCGVEALLEAAHITPHAELTDYRVSNGLLLRADIHTLFDLHLITIDECYRIKVSEQLKNSEYWGYNEQQLDRFLEKMNDQPNRDALKSRALKLKP
jgi:hypothetical protein